MNPPSIGPTLRQARDRLGRITAATELEAGVLLACVLNTTRAHLYAWPEKNLSATQIQAFDTLLKRRLAGEPLAYLLGLREFWALELEVSPAVLIPRPDTETLVEQALRLLPSSVPADIADLGTGSGAIALALAHERPGARLLATDCSPAALIIARHNAKRLGLHNIRFRQGDWCQALAMERFDLMVSNPPYIAEDDAHLMQGDLPHEPRLALVSGMDGLACLRHIITCAPEHLRPAGYLLLEHGVEQAEQVRNLLSEAGFQAIATYRDLESRARVSLGRAPPASPRFAKVSL